MWKSIVESSFFFGIVAAVLAVMGFRYYFFARPLRNYPNREPRPTAIMHREDRWLVYAFFSMFIVASVIYRSRTLRDALPSWVTYVHAGIWVALLLLAVPMAIRHRRWRKKARQFNNELCPNCGYALKGLPTRHVCPECGELYDLYKVKLDWHRATKK